MKPLVALVIAAAIAALASPATAALSPTVQAKVTRATGAHPYKLDCTYSASGQEGLALPAYRGLPGEVYVRSWVCGALNVAVRHHWRGATDTGTVAMAALILTHENVHLSEFAAARDEHRTECRALELLPAVLAALGAPAAQIPALVAWAQQANDQLIANAPTVYGPACS